MLQDLEVVAKVVDWDALEAVDLLCFLEFAVPLVPVADQSQFKGILKSQFKGILNYLEVIISIVLPSEEKCKFRISLLLCLGHFLKLGSISSDKLGKLIYYILCLWIIRRPG